MSLGDVPLTLTHATVIRPQDVMSVAEWGAETETSYAQPEASVERDLADALFAQVGYSARALAPAAGCAAANRRFRCARSKPLSDLATDAARALLATRSPSEAITGCELTIVSGSSLDASTMLQSLAGNVAFEAGSHRAPHLAISQLQGASFGAATDVVDAMVSVPGSGALFVAAERWPLPMPRLWGGSIVLGDASVALWLSREAVPGLRYVAGWQRSFDPFVSAPLEPEAASARRRENCAREDYESTLIATADRLAAAGPSEIFPEQDTILAAAAGVIADGLTARGLTSRDIYGWLSSGLGVGIDAALRERLAAAPQSILEPRVDDGYFCAAAAPILLAELLGRATSGDVPPNAMFLSWGVSFGGTVSVQVWAASERQ